MSEEARDDDNASRRGEMAFSWSITILGRGEEGGGLVLELPLLRITTSVSIHCTKLPFGAR